MRVPARMSWPDHTLTRPDSSGRRAGTTSPLEGEGFQTAISAPSFKGNAPKIALGCLLRAAVVAAVASLAASAALAQPAAQPVQVRYGFGGLARNNCWTPVLLEFPAGFARSHFDGRAVIYPAGDCDAARGRSSTAVVLTAAAEGAAPSEPDRFWLYVRPGEKPFRATAYLEGQRRYELFRGLDIGRDSFSDSAVVILAAGPSLGLEAVVDSEVVPPSGGAFRPFAGHYEVARCDLRQLPDRAIGYEGIDVLVLVDPSVGRLLREDQLEAIAQFVEQGGRLMLWVNRRWQESARGRLAELLPARLGQPVRLADLEPLRRAAGPGAALPRGEVTVLAMEPKPGSTLVLNSLGVPLAVEGPVGLGSVLVVGLDTSSPALGSWPDLPRLAAALLRLAPEKASQRGFFGGQCGEAAEGWTRPRGGFGSAAFCWAVILLAACYIVLSGPVLYLVLRSRAQLTWSWPAYFVLSLAVAGACFVIVSATRNRDVRLATLTVVDIPADGCAATGRSAHSVRFPTSALYELRCEGQGGYLAASTVGGLTIGGLLSTSDRLFDYSPTLLGLDGLPVKSNQFRYFAARWRATVAPPIVEAQVSVQPRPPGTLGDQPRRAGAEALRGTLTVRTDVADAVLVGLRQTCILGSLRKGRTVDLDASGRHVTTVEYLRDRARGLSGVGSMGMPRGYYPAGGEEERPTPVAEVVNDVCLSSFYELYRRAPLEPQDGAEQFMGSELRRTGWARQLDLTPLLDAGRAVLIGAAELDVPDGVLVDGRRPDDVKHLVVFRQVLPLK